jgi:AraC-like DNA-binding protein
MSVAAFHQFFKLVTTCSPLQYLKRIRLDQVKRLTAQEEYDASTAAWAVSYESPSQFSREFKRLYGVTPASWRRDNSWTGTQVLRRPSPRPAAPSNPRGD